MVSWKTVAEDEIQSWNKGYQKGQADIIIPNLHKHYKGFCIEFKTPENNHVLYDAQKELLERYRDNGYKTVASNDYDMIIKEVNEYMCGCKGEMHIL